MRLRTLRWKDGLGGPSAITRVLIRERKEGQRYDRRDVRTEVEVGVMYFEDGGRSPRDEALC